MPAADDSTPNVVRRLMAGQNVEDNFQKLFRAYYAPVSAFFARQGFSPEDCRDMAQEVFLAVHQGIGNLRNEAAFVGWLFSIARHLGIRHMDRARKMPKAERGAEGEDHVIEMIAARGADPLRRLLDQEKVDMVRETLQEMPERVQDCLRARLVDGMKYSEIGQKLGISENTAAVHVHRGLKNLRANLKRVFGEAPFMGEI